MKKMEKTIFSTVHEFRKRIDNDEFVEWEEVYKGSYYGTLKSELERIWSKGNNVLFDVDVKGGINLEEQIWNRCNCNFYHASISRGTGKQA